MSATTLGIFGVTAASAATPSVNLGTASSFAVLAASTLTNTGSTVISGDIGISPGTSITGFPPGVQSSGVTHTTDAQALAAQNDLTAAYLDAAGRTPFTVVSGDLGGTTLTPGVYESSSSLGLTGTLTLNGGGDAGAVFIVQTGSTFVSATGSRIVLENGAQACNVFWQVGSSVTLGSTSDFSGTVMALTSVTLNTGASVSGRILARTGAVTLDGNVIHVPTCSATLPTTTTTSAGTTTTTVGGTTTTTTSGTTTTTNSVIPVGAPGTGFGGTADPSGSPLLPIGLAAMVLAGIFGAAALRSHRRLSMTSRDTSSDRTRGS